MSGLITDLWHALRSLRQRPRFVVTAVATLGLGIGGTTAIFSALSGVVLDPLPYEEPGQLVRLSCGVGGGYFTRPDFLDVREQSRSLRSLAAYYDYSLQGFDLTGVGRPRRVTAMPVSAEYFATFGCEPILGRTFTRQDETPENRQVIISYNLWTQDLGGDPAVIGRFLELDREPWAVIGVLPAGFSEPFGRRIDVWKATDLVPGGSGRQNYYLSVVGRLRPGVAGAAAQAELDAIVSGIDAANPGRDPWRAQLQPLHEAVIGASGDLLFLLLGAVTLLLLIACVNVANLTLAHNASRERELAMRVALGCNRRRLVQVLLAESFLIAFAGGAVGLLVAWSAIDGLRALRPEALARLDAVAMNENVFLFTAVISGLSAILFGLSPALRLSRLSLEEVMRSSSRNATQGARHRRLRGILVVAEISLAFILVVGALLVAQSLSRLLAVSPGFTAKGVLTFQLSLPVTPYPVEAPARRLALERDLRHRLNSLPGVAAAGAVSRLPLTGHFNSWGYRIKGESDDAAQAPFYLADTRIVSGDYFAALEVALLRGRAFDEGDIEGSDLAAIVNRTLVERRFAGRDPIGESVGGGDEWRRIVGVVDDERIGLRDEVPDRIYYPYGQWAGDRAWTMTWVVAGQDGVTPHMPSVRAAVAELDPELVPYNEAGLVKVLDSAVARERFAVALLAAFACAALVLATVGIYGVLSYSVEKRVPEIGLRLALGAHRYQVRNAVLGEALGMTAVALLLGAAGAWLVTRWLGTLTFGISLTDPLTFIVVAAGVVVVSGVTGMIPAERALRTDPSALLRDE
jgi:putative ABC transport system permease protein